MRAERLVLLHGFTQGGGIWLPVIERLTIRCALDAPDLPGHGASSLLATSLPETADTLVTEYGSAAWVGYSMGGRLALHVALQHPHRVSHLVLCSTTAGLRDADELGAMQHACERMFDDPSFQHGDELVLLALQAIRVACVFGEYAKNDGAKNGLDSAYAFGASLGKAANTNTWEVSYLYQSVDKDALFGMFTDSDFADGKTDGKGSVFKFGYAPVKNWTVNATYFMNKRNFNSLVELDYKRLQLDFNVKY